MAQKSGRNPKETHSKPDTDPSLKNWQKWMNHRWKIASKIAHNIQRPLEMSIMNISEEYRDVNQDKLIFEYTKITTKFDKYRGNPAFWKQPITLYNPCSKDGQSEYAAVQTKHQQNKIPSLEYVGVPDVIQQEKHTLPRDRHLYKLWQNSAYREEKFKKLSAKIAQIVPHKPCYQSLVIIGRTIKKNDDSSDNIRGDLGDRLYSGEGSEGSHHNSINSQDFSRLALHINDTFITDNSIENSIKILLFFEYDLKENPSYQIKYLKLSNSGRVALRISFKKLPEFKLFKEYTRDRAQQYAFDFNTNEYLIIPEQTIEIPVYFTTHEPGFYKESWQILTRPKFWNCQIIVMFISYAAFKNHPTKTVEIQTFIDTVTRDRLVQEVIDKLINSVTDFTDTKQIDESQPTETSSL